MWKTEFLRLFDSDSPEQWREAYRLKDEHVPSRICKYREASARSLTNFQDDTVWLSAAAHLNDPYDSSLSIDCRPSFDALLAGILPKEPIPGVSQSDLEAAALSPDPLAALCTAALAGESDLTAAEASRLHEALAVFVETQSQALSQKVSAAYQLGLKICAFGVDATSLIMWAHYAACHTGFCIEYPLDSLPAKDLRRHLLFPVIYSQKRFDMSQALRQFAQAGPSLSAINKPILAAVHKSAEWAYEEEWRLVHPLGDDSAGVAVKMPKPCALYLGSRMSKDVRAELLAAARQKGTPAFEMRLKEGAFGLEPGAIP